MNQNKKSKNGWRKYVAIFACYQLLLVLVAYGQGDTGKRAKSLNVHGETSRVQTKNSVTSKALDADAIRPFRINIPESQLADLRRRIVATRYPDKIGRASCRERG